VVDFRRGIGINVVHYRRGFGTSLVHYQRGFCHHAKAATGIKKASVDSENIA
jgi:hypothetical protein